MSISHTKSPRAAQLANRLAADIEARGLQAGDRYFTTTEAAAFLGVGSGAANRALQVLERRRRIVRQQRSGAFVIDPLEMDGDSALQRVHFLVHPKYLRTEGVGQDESLLGIERELPGVPVQITFLPTSDEARFVEQLLDESANAKHRVGFVLVRVSFETQRLLAERKVPTVVYGTIYPSIEGLSCLTFDMRRVGEILGEYMLSRGHKRIAYFNRQLAFGGDQLTMEGLLSALSKYGRSPDSAVLKFLPADQVVYAAAASQLLEQADGPTGFICRTVRMADEVVAAGKSLGRVVGKDFDVAVCDYYLKANELPRYVWPKPLMSSEEYGRRLAQLLVAQVHGSEEAVGTHVVPIELDVPVALG